MYTLLAYTRMLADEVRMSAYHAALMQAVRPGWTVVDIGAGPGAFALMAARMGAGHVFAVEPNDIIEIGREIARANGLSDVITFVPDVSSAAELPVRAELIVSDLRGTLPLHGEHIPAIIDARRRWLAPGGLMIPERDTLWVAGIRAPEWYENLDRPRYVGLGDLGLDGLTRRLKNQMHAAEVRPEHVALAAQPWATLDYNTIESADVRARVTWRADRADLVHGLGLWFESDLYGSIGFSTGPDGPPTAYHNLVLPFDQPVVLSPGTSVSVDLRADLVGGDYVWQWRTEVAKPDGRPGDAVTMVQSTFAGTVISPSRLARSSTEVSGVRPAAGP